MDRRVGRVIELLQHDAFFRCFSDQRFGRVYRTFHAFRTFGQNQVGSQCFHDFTTFNTHGFRHGQSDLVAARGADKRQRDPGVTTGWFNNFHAWFQQTVLLRLPDHIGTNATFYRLGRVTAFQLGINRRVISDVTDADQRRIANGLTDIFVDFHKKPLCKRRPGILSESIRRCYMDSKR